MTDGTHTSNMMMMVRTARFRCVFLVVDVGVCVVVVVVVVILALAIIAIINYLACRFRFVFVK